jgi:hypothetical protein
VLNYLKLFPAPTNSNLSNNFTISPNKTQNYNTYDARVDHRINDKNQVFVRFSYNNVATFTPPNFGTVNGIQISGGRYNFDGPATNMAQQYLLGYTHIFSPCGPSRPQGRIHSYQQSLAPAELRQRC